jgi:hypothetical protein
VKSVSPRLKAASLVSAPRRSDDHSKAEPEAVAEFASSARARRVIVESP